jgi:hypothetical protein
VWQLLGSFGRTSRLAGYLFRRQRERLKMGSFAKRIGCFAASIGNGLSTALVMPNDGDFIRSLKFDIATESLARFGLVNQ